MTLLITGFEPFGHSDVNPSEQVARALDGTEVGGLRIATAILPVEAQRGPANLLEAIRVFRPAAVVCLGEASRRPVVSIERVAINLMDYRIRDNAGNLVADRPVAADGPAAYFASLPVRAMLEAVLAEGIPCELSLSAGAFLCNQVMYSLLHHAAQQGLDLPGGFIHLPALPQQAARADLLIPTMSLETSLRAVRAALGAVVTGLASRPAETTAASREDRWRANQERA
jgi:pyroglutamyl-peptidase